MRRRTIVLFAALAVAVVAVAVFYGIANPREAVAAPAVGGAGSGGAGSGGAGSSAAAKAAGAAGAPGQAGGNGGRGVATTVAAAAVRRGSVEAVAKLSGEVRAARSLKAYPDTGGKLMEGLVPVGTRVAAGDIVAYVDPSRPGSRFEPSPVRSPIAGTVTTHLVDPGFIASTTTAIVEIASLDELDVVVSVPERYAAAVGVGSRAQLRFGALGNRTFEARGRSADPILDPATRSKRVFFRLPAAAGIQPGMFAEVTLTLSRSASALLVPVDAIVRRGGQDVVYLVADGVAAERSVRVGLFADAEAEILSGLEEGELVIVRGQNLIRDGSRVTVQ